MAVNAKKGSKKKKSDTLTAAQRKKVPKSKQGLPKPKGPRGGAPSGNYPMPDKAHARNAKARASEMYRKGKLSKREFDQINRKADKILKGKGK